MRKDEIILSSSLYRDALRVWSYSFGSGKKSLAVVGAMRGNEVQQLYTASLLINELEKIEKDGLLNEGYEILVIPSLNPYSMNIGKRFYPIDNTDINRMFPGYGLGETTQRIAEKIFNIVKDYEYGIQFASNYMAGDFMSHINIMDTGRDYTADAKCFGIRYVVIRDPSPYDSTTLNFNWQIWDTKAFSLYTTTTERIERTSAQTGINAILAFLYSMGIIKKKMNMLYEPQVIRNSEILPVRTEVAGFFFPLVKVEEFVRAGQEIGFITDPVDNSIRSHIVSPIDGIVFFLNSSPLCYGSTAVAKVIPLSI